MTRIKTEHLIQFSMHYFNPEFEEKIVKKVGDFDTGTDFKNRDWFMTPTQAKKAKPILRKEGIKFRELIKNRI